MIESSFANIEKFLGVCKELRMRNRTGNEGLDQQLAKRAAVRQWYVSDVQDIFWSAQSDVGPIDVLPTMAMAHGRVSFAEIAENADEVLITTEPALRVKVASVDQLIESKQAVGREKDRVVVQELRDLKASSKEDVAVDPTATLDLDEVAEIFEQVVLSASPGEHEVSVTRSPADGRSKHAVWIDIAGGASEGSLIVWDSGEAELTHGSSPESVVQTHFDRLEVQQLHAVVNTLLHETGLLMRSATVCG